MVLIIRSALPQQTSRNGPFSNMNLMNEESWTPSFNHIMDDCVCQQIEPVPLLSGHDRALLWKVMSINISVFHRWGRHLVGLHTAVTSLNTFGLNWRPWVGPWVCTWTVIFTNISWLRNHEPYNNVGIRRLIVIKERVKLAQSTVQTLRTCPEDQWSGHWTAQSEFGFFQMMKSEKLVVNRSVMKLTSFHNSHPRL